MITTKPARERPWWADCDFEYFITRVAAVDDSLEGMLSLEALSLELKQAIGDCGQFASDVSREWHARCRARTALAWYKRKRTLVLTTMQHRRAASKELRDALCGMAIAARSGP